MSLDMYIFIQEDDSIEDIENKFLKNAMGILSNDRTKNMLLNKEVCYWRKHFRLNEFIFDNIFKKRFINSEEATKAVYNKCYILLTYSDILLIESNLKDLLERSYRLDKEYFKEIDFKFIKSSKFALKRGMLVMYYPKM